MVDCGMEEIEWSFKEFEAIENTWNEAVASNIHDGETTSKQLREQKWKGKKEMITLGFHIIRTKHCRKIIGF